MKKSLATKMSNNMGLFIMVLCRYVIPTLGVLIAGVISLFLIKPDGFIDGILFWVVWGLLGYISTIITRVIGYIIKELYAFIGKLLGIREE